MAHLWNELHNRALNFRGANDNTFLNVWASKIPNFEGGCKCRSFYILWRQQNPPTFNNYFDWSVRLHNAVNAKLGKRQFTLHEARSHYGTKN